MISKLGHYVTRDGRKVSVINLTDLGVAVGGEVGSDVELRWNVSDGLSSTSSNLDIVSRWNGPCSAWVWMLAGGSLFYTDRAPTAEERTGQEPVIGAKRLTTVVEGEFDE